MNSKQIPIFENEILFNYWDAILQSKVKILKCNQFVYGSLR